MDTIRQTLDTIDVRLGDLDTAVNIYSTQVLELEDMHNFLTDYTANVDNQVEFLMTLANELFTLLDNLGTESSSCADQIERLNAEINRLNGTIAKHDADMAEIQNRLNGQLNKINTIGVTVVDSNDVLNNIGQTMTNLRNEYNVKKRKRNEDLEGIRAKVRRRDDLNTRMQQIASERREIDTMLNAIETFQPPASGPGSRGGPGSRVTQGMSPANIITTPRRP